MAKLGDRTTCAPYILGLFWSQPRKDKFKFFCRTDWLTARPKSTLNHQFGPHPCGWPKFGCGATRCPRAKGASAVVGVKVEGKRLAI